jgi:flagellin-like protein
MNKGISTIIASIILLVITIGLAGTAYVFISNMLTSHFSKVINVIEVDCIPSPNNNRANITIILSNDGTMNITDSQLLVTVDGVVKSGSFDFGTIVPRTTNVSTSIDDYPMNKVHTVVVGSPSNSVRTEVWC